MIKTNRPHSMKALLVAAAVALSMTACSELESIVSGKEPPQSSSQPSPSSSSQVLTAPEREYVKGVITDNEYTSEYWGIRFALPDENAVIATDEQKKEILGLGTDAMGTDPELAAEMEKEIDSNELLVADLSTGVSLIIMSKELPMSGILPETYTKSLRQNLEQAGSNAAVEFDNDGEPETEKVAGKNFHKISYLLKVEGMAENYQSQYAYIEGKRLLFINLAYPTQVKGAAERAQELLEAIVPLQADDAEASTADDGEIKTE